MVDSKCSSASEDYATVTNQGDDTTALQLLPPREASPFKVGEIVMALHKNYPYKAKVQKIEFKQDKWRYHIHYFSWNKKWDEWLGVERVLKMPEENLQLPRDIKMKKEASNNANAQSAVQLKPNAYIESGRKKRRIDSAQVDKSSSLTKKHSNINIPPTLEKLIIKDLESRTRLGELVKLPRSPNVHEILYGYRDYRFKGILLAVKVEEIVQGLCHIFDMVFDRKLLCETERQQYKEAIVGDLTPSRVYGAEHLLRLIVKLPGLLQEMNLEEDFGRELYLTIADFLEFFEKRQTDFYPPLVIGLD